MVWSCVCARLHGVRRGCGLTTREELIAVEIRERLWDDILKNWMCFGSVYVMKIRLDLCIKALDYIEINDTCMASRLDILCVYYVGNGTSQFFFAFGIN